MKEERIVTNETWDHEGNLIYREVVKIITDEFGVISTEILSQEEF